MKSFELHTIEAKGYQKKQSYIQIPPKHPEPIILSVVEAIPINEKQNYLLEWQKTEDYIKNHLQIVNPRGFIWPYIDKREWVHCKGPVRNLNLKEYVQLYLSEHPKTSVPQWLEKEINE